MSDEDRIQDAGLPNRKHPAHHAPVERHNRPVILFVTFCTADRRRLLVSPEVHAALLSAWNDSAHWVVGRYIIMPDHIHLFCSPASRASVSVTLWVAYWKRLVSKMFPALQPMWQRGCWDTQLRCHESYTEKWHYVINNPVRAGLVKKAIEWPHCGIRHHLPW
jgi:putative transposase